VLFAFRVFLFFPFLTLLAILAFRVFHPSPRDALATLDSVNGGPLRYLKIYLLSHLFPFFMDMLAVRIRADLEAPVALSHLSRKLEMVGVCAIRCGSHAGWPGTSGPMQEWEIRPQFRLRLDLIQTIY
jgi:hypothetical protein